MSDLGLPDGSGLTLLGELRRTCDVPAIALSGYGMEEDVKESRAVGYDEHLTKPIDFPLLARSHRPVAGEKSSRRVNAFLSECSSPSSAENTSLRSLRNDLAGLEVVEIARVGRVVARAVGVRVVVQDRVQGEIVQIWEMRRVGLV